MDFNKKFSYSKLVYFKYVLMLLDMKLIAKKYNRLYNLRTEDDLRYSLAYTSVFYRESFTNCINLTIYFCSQT